MSCWVLLTLKWPVGVIRRGSLITALSLSVLSSTTTRALCLFLALHTANQTSSPALLYSGCTTRLAPSSVRPAHSAIGSTVKPLAKFFTSYTATDCDSLGSGFSGVSTYRWVDLGWLLMKSEPPPWPLTVSTTFQACFGWPLGSVPIIEIVSSPRWLVAQTGPNCGWVKLAPRPGCGILPTSISAASLPSFRSTAATLLDWLAATMK